MKKSEDRDYRAIMVEFCNSTRPPKDGMCEACRAKNVNTYAVLSVIETLREPDKLQRHDLCGVCLAEFLLIKTLDRKEQ